MILSVLRLRSGNVYTRKKTLAGLFYLSLGWLFGLSFGLSLFLVLGHGTPTARANLDLEAGAAEVYTMLL